MRRTTHAKLLAGLALLGAAGVLSCRTTQSPGVMGAYDSGEVVATVGSVKITRGELEDEAKPRVKKFEYEVWQVKSQVLDYLVQKKLWEAEAAKRGIQIDDLRQREVNDKVAAPTDDEVTAALGQPRYAPALEARLKNAKDDAEREEVRKRFAEEVRKDIQNQRLQARFQEVQAELEKAYPVTRDFWPPRAKIALKDEPLKGPQDAPVTIVEFSDFECPYCKRAAESMKQVLSAFPTQVRFAYKHMPLTNIHRHAQKAAEAAECAHEQGKFWEMHDQLYGTREGLEPEKLKTYASTLGLDAARFSECLDSGRMASRVARDMEDAKELDVNSTPTFFVNGVRLSGARPLEEFRSLIDRELSKGKKG